MAATESSARERAAMDVEREVVDLYRALYMRDHVGETFEGRVAAVTSGGLYVTLDEPFVDVLLRYEALGPDRYEVSDDELSAVGVRSGDKVTLGDRVLVEIEDVAILRRTVYGRRIPPEHMDEGVEEQRAPRRGRVTRLSREGIRTSAASAAEPTGRRKRASASAEEEQGRRGRTGSSRTESSRAGSSRASSAAKGATTRGRASTTTRSPAKTTRGKSGASAKSSTRRAATTRATARKGSSAKRKKG